MREIHDEKLLEAILKREKVHFHDRPKSMRLLRFEKGELLTQPLESLRQFLIVERGSVQIYGIDENSRGYSIAISGRGTLLGDVEFCREEFSPFFTEAAETVICLAIPFQQNRAQLENDPVFLRFVMGQLADKLNMMSKMELTVQTLEEKVLLYLQDARPDHEITSVNDTMLSLHCSRRQLQRVLKKLCDEKRLEKCGRGHYKLRLD